MDDLYVYEVDLPPGIHEAVLACADGYTIYLSGRDTREKQIQAYQHALWHIQNEDFQKADVQSIEMEAHHAKG